MGQLIDASAKVEVIEADIRTSKRNADARAGDIAAAGDSRLGPAIGMIDMALALLKAAVAAVAAALTLLGAADGESDVMIGKVRDEIFNFLKRAANHPILAAIFPDGIATYTEGDPRKQHLKMKILQTRITAEAGLPLDKREGWVAMIEVVRLPQEAAANALIAAEAGEEVANAGYRAAVRSGLIRLRGLKRDLKDLNLTEVQIHEIIPDHSKDEPKGGGKGGKGGKGGDEGGDKGK